MRKKSYVLYIQVVNLFYAYLKDVNSKGEDDKWK